MPWKKAKHKIQSKTGTGSGFGIGRINKCLLERNGLLQSCMLNVLQTLMVGFMICNTIWYYIDLVEIVVDTLAAGRC